MTCKLDIHTKESVLKSIQIVAEAAAREGFFNISLPLSERFFSLISDINEQEYIFKTKYGTATLYKENK